MKLAIFDWNGELAASIAEDEKTFGFKAMPVSDPCMGFTEFKLEGDPHAIQRFLEYYNLEEGEL
jgi:hypothetical protein